MIDPERLVFNSAGFIPVVVQDVESSKVLMVAWMNHAALVLTLESNDMWYWSRSRRKLWRKGETSGHTQRLITLTADCDYDCLLAIVNQKGPACHTNEVTCFFHKLVN